MLDDIVCSLVLRARRAFLFDLTTLFMTSPFTYLKHVREEFTHIVWPTNQTAIGHTLIVIFIAIVIALLVGLFDYLFGLIVSSIIG